MSKRKYTGSYTIRVIQLNDAKDEANCKTTKFYESSYVGMAKAYREYLEATGKISRLTEKGDIPLYVSSFGEIDTYTAILSFIKKDSEISYKYRSDQGDVRLFRRKRNN